MRPVFVLVMLFALAHPAAAQTDHFAGNARASLHVRLELAGSGRVDFPNGVEWAAIDATRGLDLTYTLVDVGNDGLPIVGGVPAGAVTPDMQGLEAKLAQCGESQACLAGVMMEFAQSGKGGQNPFASMTGMQPGRYRNFAGDRAGTCASGMAEVADRLYGVTIPPPNPAVAYNFSRIGSVMLPHDDFAVMDGVCGAEVSLDTATGAMSLRLPLASIGVPVDLGPGAFTDESSVALVEGQRTLELLDQPVGAAPWAGTAQLSFGSASHNSGQVRAALSGSIAWSLTLD